MRNHDAGQQLSMSCEDPFDDASWCRGSNIEDGPEDPTAGVEPDREGAAADAQAARELAGDDPSKCTGCGHDRDLHPMPYGACTQCLQIVASDKKHVVCGVFRRD